MPTPPLGTVIVCQGPTSGAGDPGHWRPVGLVARADALALAQRQGGGFRPADFLLFQPPPPDPEAFWQAWQRTPAAARARRVRRAVERARRHRGRWPLYGRADDPPTVAPLGWTQPAFLQGGVRRGLWAWIDPAFPVLGACLLRPTHRGTPAALLTELAACARALGSPDRAATVAAAAVLNTAHPTAAPDAALVAAVRAWDAVWRRAFGNLSTAARAQLIRRLVSLLLQMDPSPATEAASAGGVAQ